MSEKRTKAESASLGFNAGNFASAYETRDFEIAYAKIAWRTEWYRNAFVLGFFACCTLDEISDRDAYDEAYFSDAGQHVVNVARYIDSRVDEYTAESEGF